MATSAERLAAELADTRRRLVALERASQLKHSTIDVEGEAVPLPKAMVAAIEAERDLVTVHEDLDAAGQELVAQKRRVDEEILPAIEDAAASPVTDARLQAGSLTTWPFQAGVVPSGALAPGAVGESQIADFSLVARKFKDDRHRLY
ncbi:hypothetical protein [Pseudarthrobacter siccitolerans]|uniref:hypothetical protein n=1 Tax=Pseudarthrobacter siccitolerans TaxID=861266 RepID=UPI00067934E0|nr:hypothetical protein [Pseudarthrobacter siccitolerans]